MRFYHWSDSKFADWLRGTEKPTAETTKGWREWCEKAKSKNPIRYWIVEEGFSLLENIITWIPEKLYSIKYYAVNRWIDQSNALVAHPKHIKLGEYRDLSDRILFCLFDELVDFVEIEKAYSNYRWDAEKQKNMNWWQVGKWRTRTWRSAEAGLQYLEWESTITNEDWLKKDELNEVELTGQAIAAKEIIALYKWWTEVYPFRPDSMDVSGWSAYNANKISRGIELGDDDPDEDKWNVSSIYQKLRDTESAYKTEDDEMLIRLVKIRESLWT